MPGAYIYIDIDHVYDNIERMMFIKITFESISNACIIASSMIEDKPACLPTLSCPQTLAAAWSIQTDTIPPYSQQPAAPSRHGLAFHPGYGYQRKNMILPYKTKYCICTNINCVIYYKL